MRLLSLRALAECRPGLTGWRGTRLQRVSRTNRYDGLGVESVSSVVYCLAAATTTVIETMVCMMLLLLLLLLSARDLERAVG